MGRVSVEQQNKNEETVKNLREQGYSHKEIAEILGMGYRTVLKYAGKTEPKDGTKPKAYTYGGSSPVHFPGSVYGKDRKDGNVKDAEPIQSIQPTVSFEKKHESFGNEVLLAGRMEKVQLDILEYKSRGNQYTIVREEMWFDSANNPYLTVVLAPFVKVGESNEA